MEVKFGTESTLVHSPGAHYHSQMKSITSSSSGDEDSDVSDLVIENSSRFDALDTQRRKSGGSDYHPKSACNSSESGSESVSNSGSYSERSTPFSQKQNSSNTRPSDEDSEAASSRSVSTTPVPRNRLKDSTVIRKSPLNVAHRSAPSEVTAMRGYRYSMLPDTTSSEVPGYRNSMLPSRSAATNVSYTRYLDNEESDSDCGAHRMRKRKRLAKDSSESEFEVGGASGESISEEISISNEDFSEDEYQPHRRKAKRGRRKVQVWGGSESDSDYQPGSGKRRGKGGARKSVRSKNDGYTHTFMSDRDSGASSESEFEPGYAKKKKVPTATLH